LVAAVIRAGITVEAVRTWQGSRADERALKKRKNTPTLCPVCNPNAANRAKKV
jgi:hypothetical protein